MLNCKEFNVKQYLGWHCCPVRYILEFAEGEISKLHWTFTKLPSLKIFIYKFKKTWIIYHCFYSRT